MFAHDIGIGTDIGCTGGILGQRRQVGLAAHVVQLLAALQLLGQGHHVEGLLLVGQDTDHAKDKLVLAAVEIFRPHPVGHLVPGAVVQHQSTDDRLLGLHRVGRDAQLIVVRFRRVVIGAGGFEGHGCLGEVRGTHGHKSTKKRTGFEKGGLEKAKKARQMCRAQ